MEPHLHSAPGRRRTVAIGGLLIAIASVFVLHAAPASATTSSWTAVGVSCAIGNYKDVKHFSTPANTTASVYQASTTPSLIGQYHLQNSSTGNNTSAKNISNGTSKSWTIAKNGASDYWRVWHQPAEDVNCNGAAPGNGNSELTGWVTF